VVKEILTDELSPPHSAHRRERQRRMLADLSGTWTAEQADEFDAAVSTFDRIDPQDWK